MVWLEGREAKHSPDVDFPGPLPKFPELESGTESQASLLLSHLDQRLPDTPLSLLSAAWLPAHLPGAMSTPPGSAIAEEALCRSMAPEKGARRQGWVRAEDQLWIPRWEAG